MAPRNIINASSLVRSIQYTVEQCDYNPLIYEERNCSVVSKIPHLTKAQRQSTRLHFLYRKNKITMSRYRDVAFLITSIALNGQDGDSNKLVTRLDPSSGKQFFFLERVL